MYRSFSYLHSRLLLNLQDEVRSLEQKLDTLDKLDAANSEDGVSGALQSRVKDLRKARQDWEGSRQALLAELRQKLLEYGTHWLL